MGDMSSMAAFCSTPAASQDWRNPATYTMLPLCAPYRAYQYVTGGDYAPPPPAAPPGAPQTYEQMMGDWSPEQAAAAGQAATVAREQAFFQTLDASVNRGAAPGGWSWIGFGGVLLGVVLLGRLGGR